MNTLYIAAMVGITFCLARKIYNYYTNKKSKFDDFIYETSRHLSKGDVNLTGANFTDIDNNNN